MTTTIQARHWIGFGLSAAFWLVPVLQSALNPEQKPIVMPVGSTLFDVPGIYLQFAFAALMGLLLGLALGLWVRRVERGGHWRGLALEGALMAGGSYALVHYVPFAFQFLPLWFQGAPLEFVVYGLGTGTLSELLFASLAAFGGAVGVAVVQLLLSRPKAALG